MEALFLFLNSRNQNTRPPQFVAGQGTSFYLTKKGQLYACGDNTGGQLGLDVTSKMVPVWTPVPTPEPVVKVHPATNRLFISGNSGRLYSYGEGYTEDTALRQWTEVPSLTNARQISSNGRSHLAIAEGGQLYGSGINRDGELGIGFIGPLPTWTALPLFTPVVDVAVFGTGSVVVTEDGRLFICGSDEESPVVLLHGVICDPESEEFQFIHWTEVPSFPATPLRLASGDNLFITTVEGQIYCTGLNSSGQLGLGDREVRYDWVNNPLKTDLVAQLYTTEYASYAVIKGGYLLACGDNSRYQLGTVEPPAIRSWLLISVPAPVLWASPGRDCIFIGTTVGIYAHGSDESGQMALGANRLDLPVQWVKIEVPGE